MSSARQAQFTHGRTKDGNAVWNHAIQARLISAHGGVLVDLMACDARRTELRSAAKHWPSWSPTRRQLCDLELRLGMRVTSRLDEMLVLASRSEVRRGEWDRFGRAPFRVEAVGSVKLLMDGLLAFSASSAEVLLAYLGL